MPETHKPVGSDRLPHITPPDLPIVKDFDLENGFDCRRAGKVELSRSVPTGAPSWEPVGASVPSADSRPLREAVVKRSSATGREIESRLVRLGLRSWWQRLTSRRLHLSEVAASDAR